MKSAHRFLMYGIPKSFLLKIILFLVILLIGKNVFAAEFNMNSYTSGSLNGTKNRYRAVEIDNSGTANIYTFGTQYSGRISTIETYFSYPFEKDTTYTLTYNMNTDDFRNNFGARYWWDCSHEMNATNQHLGSFTYVSYRKVKFSFTPTEATNCVRVLLGSSNQSSQAITGVTNWRLNSITIYDPDFQSGSGGGQGTSTPTPSPGSSTPTPTPDATNQDIINNQNNNTQDIINNQSENTSDIINNANQNTQEIIENNTCPIGPLRITREDFSALFGRFLGFDGSEQTNLAWSISPYFIVKPDTEYSLDVFGGTLSGSTYYCFYSNNKSLRACYPLVSSSSSATITFKTDSYTSFIRLSIGNRGYSLKGPICNNWEKEGLKDIADAIKDDNVESGTGSDFFDSFSSTDNGGISGIISKPLVLINSLLDNNNSCNNLSFNIKFPSLPSKSVSFPSGCVLWDNVPNSMINIYHMFIVGFCSYYLLKRLFKDIEDLKNPERDEVEVIDL